MKFYVVKTGRKPGIYESWDECSKNVHGYPGAVYKSFKTWSEAARFLKGSTGEEKKFPEKNLSEEELPGKISTETDLPEKDIPEKNLSEENLPGENFSENDLPEKISSETDFPEKDIPEKNLSEKNLPENDSSENDLTEDASPEDRVPDDEEDEENKEFRKSERKRKRFPKIRDHIETGRVDEFVLNESADAYVDGSYLETTGEFSYGCVVLCGNTEFRFYEKMTDPELAAMHNVAGEIKGAEAAMRFAIANGIRELTIYHDYEGIARWCTGEWTAKKNGTIAYSNFYQNLPKDLRVRFVKVQGHSGDTYNELADRLAKFALGITE